MRDATRKEYLMAFRSVNAYVFLCVPLITLAFYKTNIDIRQPIIMSCTMVIEITGLLHMEGSSSFGGCDLTTITLYSLYVLPHTCIVYVHRVFDQFRLCRNIFDEYCVGSNGELSQRRFVILICPTLSAIQKCMCVIYNVYLHERREHMYGKSKAELNCTVYWHPCKRKPNENTF